MTDFWKCPCDPDDLDLLTSGPYRLNESSSCQPRMYPENLRPLPQILSEISCLKNLFTYWPTYIQIKKKNKMEIENGILKGLSDWNKGLGKGHKVKYLWYLLLRIKKIYKFNDTRQNRNLTLNWPWPWPWPQGQRAMMSTFQIEMNYNTDESQQNHRLTLKWPWPWP